MPNIYSSDSFSRAVAQGIDAFAAGCGQPSTKALETMSALLQLERNTLAKWRLTTTVPESVDDRRLFRFIWLVLFIGGKGETWLKELLGSTSILLISELTPDWLRVLIRQARLPEDLRKDRKKYTLNDADLDADSELSLDELWEPYKPTESRVEVTIEHVLRRTDESHPLFVQFAISLADTFALKDPDLGRYWENLILGGLELAELIDQNRGVFMITMEWAIREAPRTNRILVTLMMQLTHYMDSFGHHKERIKYGHKAADAAHQLMEDARYDNADEFEARLWDEAILRIDTLGWTYINVSASENAIEQITQGLELIQHMDRPAFRNLHILGLSFRARAYMLHSLPSEDSELRSLYLSQAQKDIETAEQELANLHSKHHDSTIANRLFRIKGDLAISCRDWDTAYKAYEQAKVASQDLSRRSQAANHETCSIYYRLGFIRIKQEAPLSAIHKEFSTAEAIFTQTHAREVLYALYTRCGQLYLADQDRKYGNPHEYKQMIQSILETVTGRPSFYAVPAEVVRTAERYIGKDLFNSKLTIMNIV